MYNIEEIRMELFSMQDLKYREFHSRLMPTVDKELVIGVRTPDLRKYAKKLVKEKPELAAAFLKDLPHKYYEENNLHAFIVEQIKDFDECLGETDRFLTYIDNWATCDCFVPKVFKNNPEQLLAIVERWVKSDEVYRVRYGVKMLMDLYLEEYFEERFLEMAASAADRLKDYYIKMVVAWYFATALAKQYDAVLPYIESCRLESWTHNKAIQKAIESYRITPEQKEYLRTLKVQEAKIIKWNDKYSKDFIDISMEWLVKYDLLEDIDLEILNHPYENILYDGGMIFFARLGKDIAGTVSMMKMDEKSWEIVKLGVKEKYQGRGIGRKLMDTVMDFAYEKGAEKIVLFTNSKLATAIELYFKYGFKEIPMADNEYEEADKKMELYL